MFNSNPPLLERCQCRAEDLRSAGETKKNKERETVPGGESTLLKRFTTFTKECCS